MARAVLLLLAACVSASRPVSHVHLSMVSDVTKMSVQWSSAAGDVLGNGSSTVQYGSSARRLDQSRVGSNWTYVDTSSNRSYSFNLATMTGLLPGSTYYYRVGDPLDGWSSVSSFVATRTAAQASAAAPLVVGVLGDMGWTYAQALTYLQTEVAQGNLDFIVHVGDFAYDLNYQNGNVGDEFQSSIEPMTTSVPYMGCPGNHEGAMAFDHYTHRFRVFVGEEPVSGLTPSNLPGLTPGLPNNHWYSWDAGLVHFVSMSTEAYFFYAGSAVQYAWLQADLTSVDRAVTPWVVVYGHRSIYCSCDGDCDSAATTVRDGPYGLEALMVEHKVDLWLNGHEHNYERNYAVFNSTLVTGGSAGAPGGNASAPEVVLNAASPVYIVTGCAGDVEHHEPFTRPQPAYSAFRSNTYGYSRMTVYNASALLWEQVQTDNEFPATTGTVIDAMLLLKA